MKKLSLKARSRNRLRQLKHRQQKSHTHKQQQGKTHRQQQGPTQIQRQPNRRGRGRP